MRQLRGFDPLVYVRALGLLARNPVIIVVPLLVAVAGVLIAVAGGAGSDVVGSLTNSLAGFILLLLNGFALGTATILADQAWRTGRTSFDDGYAEAKRKAGDMLFATMGFSFVLFAVGYVGVLLGPLALVLYAVAVFFLIYTIPAAALGGMPGGAALSASIERAREAPLPTIVVTVVTIAVYLFLSPLIANGIFSLIEPLIGSSGSTALLISRLTGAIGQAIGMGYVALVLGKTYTDLAFRPRW